MKKKKKYGENAVQEAAQIPQSASTMTSETSDPLGMWTGSPADDAWPVPEQDPDDL